MNVVLVRVDNRLVHGQIIEAWIPFTKAACLAVIDDDVANDLFRTTVIRMAVPREIEVIVSRVEDFAGQYLPRPGKEPTIVLFSSIDDVKRARACGFPIAKLNIGNIYADECQIKCSPCVLLSGKDVEVLRALLNAGVQIDVRRVPGDKPLDIRDLIEGATGESVP
ncbi:MAG: PTS sugar transporter subunit IIB [Syntrophales bacterium]|jgi:PTS system mannose-specific IIB component|nr:PTS sugar transporter subunit IIB [Syntrophales bacterium]MDD4338239.1 PTS sugar transporter subunit IIB [Syntrophales bacterium]HOG06907.1 PTS sugar transporter subunit IIB [Syntrophales bacterium]HOS77344.1 PTS sugar transporter subunit IIB [Syntrophales bacterium]HPB71110.1 PTS sugar transporter subunit IIB [Syntrophales bacterium]